MAPTFNIPPEFQAELELVDITDTRTNEEILNALTQHAPVISEKNVWAYWHAGVKAMPEWCQHNVVDWVRILGPEWTVRVLDTVPNSPNHALNFVSANLLPETFIKGTMDGPYTGPHSADFLRGALLYTHGGVNMDVGCILTRHLDRICWNELENPNSPYEVAVPIMYGQTIANHFVAARKGNPFIQRWHQLFTHLWKGRNSHEGVSDDPLISFAKELGFGEASEASFTWDFKVSPLTVMEYIAQVICWQRLCMLEDAGDGFSCSDYWQTHIFCWDVLTENWGGEMTVGFDGAGQKMYDLLSLKRDIDPNSEEYKKAHELVWRILAKSSLQKITHGKNLTHSVHLGTLWDENPGKDCEEGTFAELLRYGTVRFRQTRETIVRKEAAKPKLLMKKGVLEP
ncbi:capsule polysaccharide biosynthesis [Trichoderma arundinaceum]|uniref:Capsule polysaccharide biosynthesis n=1 Tax=Trichoderma arundinaceum TaxID=490622 RepID=A0A395NAA6_TRIAR|nr:capsule polysaccharide biosynthesis [Trichoderma arundinaceum]